jgi:hypothetical protein
VPGEPVARNHSETVSRWGSSVGESGIVMKSSPENLRALPKKMPLIHDGSFASA